MDTVRPGDPRVNVSSVPPYRVTWTVYAVSADGQRTRVAVWTDSERAAEVDERELTRFESTVRYVNGRERHDIVHWDPVTKVPATVELRGYNDRGGWAFIGYERGRAVTVYRRGLNEDARWVLAVPGFVARLEVPRRTGGTDVWVFDAMKKLVPR